MENVTRHVVLNFTVSVHAWRGLTVTLKLIFEKQFNQLYALCFFKDPRSKFRKKKRQKNSFLKMISVFFLSENCKTILLVRWLRIFAHISKTSFATFAGILDNQAFRFDQQSENLLLLWWFLLYFKMAAKMKSMEVKTAAMQLLFLQYLSRAPMPNSRKISTEKG